VETVHEINCERDFTVVKLVLKAKFFGWETAAAVTSVRHQSYTRGEAKVSGAAFQGD